jgi:hypothetical protein
MSIRAVEDAIRRIREQVATFSFEEYRYREMETRYALIDPIIEALGWETANFDQRAYEADPKWESFVKRNADYVFWGPDSPHAVVVVEAKRASNELKPAPEEAQLSGYVEDLTAGVAVLTNGKIWYLYDPSLRRRRSFSAKRIEEVKILDGSMRSAARSLHEWLNVGNWW